MSVRESSSTFALLGALACAALVACAGSERFDDGSQGADAGGDVDAGFSPNPVARLGAACTSDGECPEGLYCDEEIPGKVTLAGVPGGSLDLPLFPGGSCSPLPLAPYDAQGDTSCDPSAPQAAQGCGVDGTCVSESVASATVVACRVACQPSASESGCAREGYTCDFRLHACIEGCASDSECRVLSVDGDGDGAVDGLAYDAASKATCEVDTGRCAHPAPAAAQVGTPCATSDDCETDGSCIRESSTLAGHVFPSGFCTKLGCDVEGRECDAGNVCEPLRPWTGGAAGSSTCLTRCQVGAEPAAQRLGALGHGAGCREGYRCHYNGGAGADFGVCVGGDYNEVVDNNVGDGCDADADCYSPYGYGRCMRLSVGGIAAQRGTCTILDCAGPGLPDALCGDGRECILLRDDITFCVRNCAAAADCPDGAACADDDADQATPSVCFPACFADEECRDDEQCEVAAGASLGQCVAMAGQGG